MVGLGTEIGGFVETPPGMGAEIGGRNCCAGAGVADGCVTGRLVVGAFVGAGVGGSSVTWYPRTVPVTSATMRILPSSVNANSPSKLLDSETVHTSSKLSVRA